MCLTVESGVAVFNSLKKKDIYFLEGVQDSLTRKLVMPWFGTLKPHVVKRESEPTYTVRLSPAEGEEQI